jgi:hypothetical protein
MDFASQKATLTGWGYTTLTPVPGTDPRYDTGLLNPLFSP